MNSQTLNVSTTDIATFSDQESICNANDPTNTDYFGFVYDINYGNGTVKVRSKEVYTANDTIQSLTQLSSQGNALRYLVIDSVGNVTGHQPGDPGFVQQGPGTQHTLKFPATFANGNSPDTDFPAGTSLRMEIEAVNSAASDTYLSNAVTPT